MARTVREFDLLDAHIGIFHRRNLRQIDWPFAAIVLVLATVGLVGLYSVHVANPDNSPSPPYFVKQAGFFLAGACLALFIMCLDSRFLVSMAPIAYCVAILLLVAVETMGTKHRLAERWLEIGPFRLQPSEQTKLVLVFMLTWYFTTIKERIRKFPFFVLTFAIMGLPALLILKQPSLGTALCLVPVTVVMVYVAGCKWWHLALLILAGLAAAPFAYTQLEDYQKERVLSFRNPEADPRGNGWQTRQSKITIGSGGMTGKGFGKGTQTMLSYLSDYHTDFVFALLAEQAGFAGAAAIIGLFAVFLLRGMRFALTAHDMPGSLLAAGAVTLLAFHVFVNIAITLGLMPVTGIPLPFLSYGGSFYITTMMCAGVLLNVPVRKQLFD